MQKWFANVLFREKLPRKVKLEHAKSILGIKRLRETFVRQNNFILIFLTFPFFFKIKKRIFSNTFSGENNLTKLMHPSALQLYIMR